MGVYYDKYKKYYDSILKVEKNFTTFEKIINETNDYSNNYILLSDDLVFLSWDGDSKKNFSEKISNTLKQLIEVNSDISSNGKLIIGKSLELKSKIEALYKLEQEQDSVNSQLFKLNNLKNGIDRKSPNFAFAFWTNKDQERLNSNNNRLRSINQEMTTLITEIDKIINILQNVSYNVFYKEETPSTLADTSFDSGPSSRIESQTKYSEEKFGTLGENTVNVVEETKEDSNKIVEPQEMVKVSDILDELGVVRDKFGNPKKINGHYIVKSKKYPGADSCDYMLYLPEDENGEIPKGLQIIFEMHGNGGSKTFVEDGVTKSCSIEQLANKMEMGVRVLEQDPNLNAIIFKPQAVNGGNTGYGTEMFGRTYEDVVKATDAQEKAIVLQFSAGGSTGHKYARMFPQYVKGMVSVDPSPNTEIMAGIPKEIPITFFTSNSSKRGPYDEQLNNTYETNAMVNAGRTLTKYEPIQTFNYNADVVEFNPMSKLNGSVGVGQYNPMQGLNDGVKIEDLAQTYLTPTQRDVGNVLRQANQTGDRKINIPGTSHERLRDVVFNAYNYNIMLDVFK